MTDKQKRGSTSPNEMKCARCGYPVSNKVVLLCSFECPRCGATNYVTAEAR
jgi:ribosomal protein L37E